MGLLTAARQAGREGRNTHGDTALQGIRHPGADRAHHRDVSTVLRGYVYPLLGDELFVHQHGRWERDYQDEVPALHDPSTGRHIAVAEIDRSVAGYVAWGPAERAKRGQIQMLAVSPDHRHQAIGRTLCRHAIDAMRASGVEVVGVGTGDDAFHARARALYESLGFTKIPIASYLKRV